MCGIVGYIGTRKVIPILLDGLKRLEYRGYDSAGLVYLQDGRLVKYRAQGKLANLEKIVEGVLGVESHVGLGHTRWATHGAPTTENAHPHGDCKDDLVVVHNGIIENYQTLRAELKKKGHIFRSETDTEVLAHLIEEYLDKDLVQAVRKALKRVQGSFAVGVLWRGQPDTIVAARNHSPLVLGISNSEGTLLASDVPALLPYTRDVVFLEDKEIAVLASDKWEVRNLASGRKINKQVQTITWDAGMAEKAGFKHFMLKEIYEQPQALINTLRGRIDPQSGRVELPELKKLEKELKNIERIALVACGTSWHAALVAKYWFEEWVGIPVEVDIASEFRYRKLLLHKKVLTLSISQSGETADTLAGTRLASQLGSRVITICNVVGSTMTREADATLYTHAGPEIGVASTKAFTTQLLSLLLLTVALGRRRQMTLEQQREIVEALRLAGHSVAESDAMEESIAHVDIVYSTRLQEERFASAEEAALYRGRFRLNQSIYTRHCDPNTVIMHPLPRDSREVARELDDDLNDNPNLAIFRQTDNGVLVRMALFALTLDVVEQVDAHARDVLWYTGGRFT